MDYNIDEEEREVRPRTIMVDSNGYEIIKDEKTYVSPYDMIQKGENDTPKFLEFALGFNKVSKFLQNGFNKFATKEQVFLGRDSLGRPYILENGNATDNPRMKAIKKQYAPLIKEGNNIMFDMNPLLVTDYYKTTHHEQYPKGLKRMVSYMTPRMTRIPKQTKLICIGPQAYSQEYLVDYFNKNFFNMPLQEVVDDYKEFLDTTLAPI